MRDIIQCLQLSNQSVTPEQTVTAIKNAGFDGVFVQWYADLQDEEKIRLVRFCREKGLKIPFAHLGYGRINEIWQSGDGGDEVLSGYIADLRNLSDSGIEKALVHVSSGENPPKPSELGAERYFKLCAEAEKLGIRILFENNKVKGYLEYVFDHIRADNAGICFDAGHCHAHFKDDFPWKRLGKKIEELHLHDNFGTDDQHLLPFDGTLPWESYARSLKKCGYDGAVTLESRYYGDYLHFSVEDFYKTAYEKAKILRALFD